MLGGIVLIAALFAGWWAIDRVQEHLPGPVNALIDGVQYGGMPSGAPVIAPVESGEADPFAACPDFARDVRVAGEAVEASRTLTQAQVDANNEVIAAEMTRMSDGGAARPLADTGVAAALRDQADGLDALAAALRRVEMQTPEAASLAVGIAAASERVAEANRVFIDQGAGTPAQWQQWVDSVAGPIQQVEVATRALGKCPA